MIFYVEIFLKILNNSFVADSSKRAHFSNGDDEVQSPERKKRTREEEGNLQSKSDEELYGDKGAPVQNSEDWKLLFVSPEQVPKVHDSFFACLFL